MTQIGNLFKKTPYLVRDEDSSYKSIEYVENIIDILLTENDLNKRDLKNVFSNNRDNILHFHIIIKKNIKHEHLCITYENEDIEFTFEEYKESKTKTRAISSFMFLEAFKHQKEKHLLKVFDDIIGCDGKILFISLPKNDLKLFQPSSKHYHYRNILIAKKDLICETATSFGIDCKQLYVDLDPNIIKQVCKDLNMTYKSLSFELGYKPDTINKAASTGKISDQLNKSIEFYLENLRLREELKQFELIKQTLQNVAV